MYPTAYHQKEERLLFQMVSITSSKIVYIFYKSSITVGFSFFLKHPVYLKLGIWYSKIQPIATGPPSLFLPPKLPIRPVHMLILTA